MRTLLGLVILIVAVIAVLIFFGFLQLSPEGEQAIDGAQDSVGEALENTGEAIQDGSEPATE
ncbi:hypothetical protein ATO8_03316 [Roseivivax marinus]|jgi:hypothetical protein|uniref:Uncharacterized protein n=1 Tax=Roseivivax marinus TaxID=1379903 RepID=W4HMC6_9RHOB|nr:hypothetical protein [Roseivivax marinus]ETW13887.1 hypothetical protein ATO8_03316 [Roseivivax marinus]UMA63835.1 hypothetical protein LVO79_12440 [Roseivivax marinus]SEK88056.1 hypothetical protein SAMN05444413_10467 [Roseivivax marinus]